MCHHRISDAHDPFSSYTFINVDVSTSPVLKNIQQSVHSNNNGLLFNFDILQSGIASSCVVKYNIMITGIGCNYTRITQVNVTELNATYNTMSVGALPVCCEEYKFRVFGVDRSNRESEQTIGRHTVEISGISVVCMYICVCVCMCVHACVHVCM